MTTLDRNITLPVIVGPTAVGKTAAGVLVAEAIGAEIISADSRQVYRHLSIGTGAPTEDEIKCIPHHLVGIVDPEVRLSAGEFAKLARESIDGVIRKGKAAIVVGGSGLYIRAMIDGLANIPPVDYNLHREIQERIDERGMEAMIEALRRFDPEYADKVGPSDRKRLTRALEVYELTGRSFSEWHREQRRQEWCQPLFFGLNRPHDELHEIITQRIDAMLNNGWIDEVRDLMSLYSSNSEDKNGDGSEDILPPSVTEAVGYRDIIGYLHGEIDLKTARERIIISTRQFAKRQLTWFRADDRIRWLEETGSGAVNKWVSIIVDTHKFRVQASAYTR